MRRSTKLFAIALGICLAGPAEAQDLILNNQTVTLGGVRTYGTVALTNSKIIVPPFNGTDKVNTGNLEIRASSITIDASSSIVADGAGYQPRRCDHGAGPTPTAGGRGGCAVLDSGGGGAHFGAGGRGTKDCFCFGSTTTCSFPQEFEESCGSLNAAGTACIQDPPGATVPGTCQTNPPTCYNYDGLPTVAGQPYWHSIWVPEFGAAGGDKGCRDGFDNCSVGGAGGGRIVLAAVNASQTGVLSILGTVSANGHRGCGSGNDSGGGGAGGTILLVGDSVVVSSGAKVSAAGGLGGDTNAKQPGSTCPACAQAPGGTCDDCGGGGGGGIISVLSRVPASLASTSVFNVRGAEGGTCTICKGEAGGGAGELQLAGVYTGELCDGHDNDFDGVPDDNLGTVTCGSGLCTATLQLCGAGGIPNDCVPVAHPTCMAPLTDNRPRFMVIADSSGSMLTDLNGAYTFGDGSAGHAGIDTNGDGQANDSRLFKAKNALTNVIAAYPEIDFALARYAQGVAQNVNCQLAHWFECAGLCCTYDDPTNNTGTNPEGPCVIPSCPTPPCTIPYTDPPVLMPNVGSHAAITVLPTSSGNEHCINYAGSCGSPRRGADILVGFQRPLQQTLMWLDHKETAFLPGTSEGDHCVGGDCELRGTGPTPLADSLYAVKAYLDKVKALDTVASCRKYAVILLTDGAESCQGNPVTAAAALLGAGIQTYVVGFSVLPTEKASLNQIAAAGGTTSAYFAADETQLAAALASIVSKSVMFEKCNGLDDNCNNLCDEDWPEVAVTGASCTNKHAAQSCSAGVGVCQRSGVYQCKADGSGSQCSVTPGPATCPGNPACNNQCGLTEICGNGLDDDCNGVIDECCPFCVPQPEICDGKDNNCNGQVDEGYQSVPCGSSIGECKQGTTACVNGAVVCNGATGPTAEICDNLDNNCDTIIDNFSEACYPAASGCDLATGVCKGVCKIGSRLCTAGKWGACVGFQGPSPEVCNGLDDDCEGVVDDGVDSTCMDYATCTPYSSCATCPSKPLETCDGKDNDCNGQTDETFPEKGKVCGSSVGECTPGVWACEDGKLVCQGGALGNPEVCDGKDNDCNGKIDDNVPGAGESCWPAGTPEKCQQEQTSAACGECKPGKTECVGGGWVCTGGVGPVKEICDGKDNDCDGNPDNAAECPGGSTCVEGQCVLPCGSGEFSCPGGTICSGGWCLPDPCAKLKCKPTERCILPPAGSSDPAKCVEKCANVSCSEHEKCQPTTGRCVDDSCVTKGCPPGQACVGYTCVADPCPPGKCPSDQTCSDGTCYPTCLNVTCKPGELCVRGKCVKTACQGYPCDSGFVCKEGADGKPGCVADPCLVVSCPKGERCLDGKCVRDPCAVTRCPEGLRCEVNALGLADCIATAEVPTTTLTLATGGGGCACNTGGGEEGQFGGLALLLLVGLAVGARSTRGFRGRRAGRSRAASRGRRGPPGGGDRCPAKRGWRP